MGPFIFLVHIFFWISFSCFFLCFICFFELIQFVWHKKWSGLVPIHFVTMMDHHWGGSWGGGCIYNHRNHLWMVFKTNKVCVVMVGWWLNQSQKNFKEKGGISTGNVPTVKPYNKKLFQSCQTLADFLTSRVPLRNFSWAQTLKAHF